MCGETTLVVTNSAQSFEWVEFGLKLHIREGTLPAGVDKCIVRIKASTSGQYQLPQDFQLVSAIFWLRCEPMCKFAKSVTMEMDHCAKLENAASLTFMRAKCDQEQLPYIFKEIGGSFSEEKSWGNVELNRFSAEAVALKGGGPEQDQSYQRQYSAMIFHTIPHDQSITSYRIDFVVTWNSKTHLKVGF